MSFTIIDSFTGTVCAVISAPTFALALSAHIYSTYGRVMAQDDVARYYPAFHSN